jgi:hypothetical protein
LAPANLVLRKAFILIELLAVNAIIRFVVAMLSSLSWPPLKI